VKATEKKAGGERETRQAMSEEDPGEQMAGVRFTMFYPRSIVHCFYNVATPAPDDFTLFLTYSSA